MDLFEVEKIFDKRASGQKQEVLCSIHYYKSQNKSLKVKRFVVLVFVEVERLKTSELGG